MENEEYKKLESIQSRGHLGKAWLLGIQFLCLFSAFISFQNMIAELFEQNEEKNLGVISLIVLYFTFGLFSIVATNICSMFNPKWIMVVSSFGYAIYFSTGLLVSHCHKNNDQDGICDETARQVIVIIGSIICGISSATIWVSQAWYIANISTVPTRGIYYGVFFACMMSSQITGNMLSAILLSYSTNTYFIALTFIAIGSGFLFTILPSIEVDVQDNKSLGERISRTCHIMGNRMALPLIFYYVLEGSIVAFYTGFLYRIVKQSISTDESNTDINLKIAYVFIVLGIFEFIGGILSGYLADKINRYIIATASTLVVELALILSIMAFYLKDYTLCFFTGALWGLSDSIVQNMCTVISSTLFPNQIEVFGVMRFVQGISITLTLLISIYVEQEIIFILVVAMIEILANIMSSKMGVIREKKIIN